MLNVGVVSFSVFTVVYLLAVFSLDSSFFKRDLQNKFSQVKGVSVKLGVLVAGDPQKPIVQSESGCNGENPYLKISWDQDPLAASFKVIRDGELLAIGIIGAEYTDSAVASGTHQYIVTAVGANGIDVSSDLVEVVVGQCLVPFDFKMEVQNPDKIVYAGEELYLKTTISKLRYFEPWEGTLSYEIRDLSGNKLIETSDQVNIFDNQEIYKKINLSKLIKTEKYKISVKISYKNFNIFSEDEFYLKEKPFIYLSSGRVVTLTEIFSGLGWLIMLLLALILIFLLLLVLEHRLAEDAKTQITESIFKKNGFLGKEVYR